GGRVPRCPGRGGRAAAGALAVAGRARANPDRGAHADAVADLHSPADVYAGADVHATILAYYLPASRPVVVLNAALVHGLTHKEDRIYAQDHRIHQPDARRSHAGARCTRRRPAWWLRARRVGGALRRNAGSRGCAGV